MAVTGSKTPPGERDFYQTPPDLVARLDRDYGPLDLDAAATGDNHKFPRWLGPGGLAADALTVTWARYGRRAFCNPPYSRPLLPAFVAHAQAQIALGLERAVLVLPSTTEVDWFHQFVWDARGRTLWPGVRVEFLPRRVRFLRPDGTVASEPTGATVVVIFGAP